MKVTNATLVVDELHDEVHAVSENNQIIGYLAKSNNDELPVGAVSLLVWILVILIVLNVQLKPFTAKPITLHMVA